MTDDIRLPFQRSRKLREKRSRKLRAARGSGITATSTRALARPVSGHQSCEFSCEAAERRAQRAWLQSSFSATLWPRAGRAKGSPLWSEQWLGEADALHNCFYKKPTARLSHVVTHFKKSNAQPRRAATLRVAGASEGCRFAAAGPNNVRQPRAATGLPKLRQ